MHKASENRHLIMGYLFLGLVFMGAISSVYYWENKTKGMGVAQQSADRHVESGEQIPTVNGATCELKTVTAKHRKTGELRDFPSVCHVTENWTITLN
jgi:hypothetical protein